MLINQHPQQVYIQLIENLLNYLSREGLATLRAKIKFINTGFLRIVERI